MKLITHPGIKIKPPSFLNNNQWIIENYLEKRRYLLNKQGVFIIIFCFNAQQYEDVVKVVNEKLGISREKTEDFINKLKNSLLLLDNLSDELREYEKMKSTWSKKGWGGAYDYHLSTYNYEFIGANHEGREQTKNRMINYSALEPDSDRFKEYDNVIESHSISYPNEGLVPIPAKEVWNKTGNYRVEMDKETLCNIVAMTFGKVNEVKPNWNGKPLIQKTSPSGGARHPSEGYIIVKDIPDLKAGLYHYCVGSSALNLINENIEEIKINRLFPLMSSRAQFRVQAIVVITSVFERNMYRYREPRTFRTVHMDAGHLCSTVEVLSSAYGIKSFVQYGGKESDIEKLIGIDGLEEGYMVSIGLGM